MDPSNDPLSPAAAERPLAPQPPGTARQSPIFYGPNGLRAGWRLLVFLAILSALFSVAALALRLFTHRPRAGTEMTPEVALLGEGLPLVLVLLASWIMAKMEARRIGDYGLPRQTAFGARFWLGVAVGFASISALLGTLRISGAFRLQGMALRGTGIWKYAFFWAIVFLIVGLFEEFLFRGYSLFTLTTGIGFWPAAAVSSLAFGYVHHHNPGENWVGAFDAGLVGLLFCLLLRRTGDLWMPIGFHAAWDWGETYFYGVPDSGQVAPGHLFTASFSGPPWLTGGTVGPEGSYLCVALIVFLCAIFALSLPTAHYPAPEKPTRGPATAAPSDDRNQPG